MPFYETERAIAATPDAVWSVLTNPERLADGTFSILKIEGEITDGKQIALWSEVDPKRRFALTVRDVRPGASMIWESGMPLGLFKGSRRFTVAPDAGGTRFRMREDYTGPLAGLMFKVIPDLQPSFETFGDGLKAAAEGTRV